MSTNREIFIKEIEANMAAQRRMLERARQKLKARFSPDVKPACMCSPNMRDLRYSEILKWFQCNTCSKFISAKGGMPDESPWS